MSRPRPAETSPDDAEAARRVFAQAWGLLRSVPAPEFLPEPDRPEIAFAGRSNVGKSSLINALVGQHGLARTSNTPGRTQDLVFFTAPMTAFYLVDLPGYGFAKAPKDKVDAWTRLVTDYLRGRRTLKRVYLLIDARHGAKPVDLRIMDVLDEAAVSYQLVLTKADKINETSLAAVTDAVAAVAHRHAAAYPEVIATSTVDALGIEALRTAIHVAATADAV